MSGNAAFVAAVDSAISDARNESDKELDEQHDYRDRCSDNEQYPYGC